MAHSKKGSMSKGMAIGLAALAFVAYGATRPSKDDPTPTTDTTTVSVSLEKYTEEELSKFDVPTEEYIIACLKNVSSVTEVCAATPENDPNGKLGRPDGYTSIVFFVSDLVPDGKVTGETAIEKGTDGGGSIETYSTAKDARDRDSYLSKFDNGLLDSGAHFVAGTLIVRISTYLSADQQQDLVTQILDALSSGASISADLAGNPTSTALKESQTTDDSMNAETSDSPPSDPDGGSMKEDTIEKEDSENAEMSTATQDSQNATGVSTDPLSPSDPSFDSSAGSSSETTSFSDDPQSAGTTQPPTEPDPPPVNDTDEYVQMVWIPQSGTKYHSNKYCSNMDDPTEVTLEQAESWGYTPCKKCY